MPRSTASAALPLLACALALAAPAPLLAHDFDRDVTVDQRAVQFQEEGVKGTPNDIADEGWIADFPDPYDFLNILLNGASILTKNGDNFSYFNDPTFNAQMDKAAQLTGSQRSTTYGNITTAIKTQQAPWAAWSNQTNYDFFSQRVGCQLWQPAYSGDSAISIGLEARYTRTGITYSPGRR